MHGNGGGKGGGSVGSECGKDVVALAVVQPKVVGVALWAVAVVAGWLFQGVEEDHTFQGTLFKVIPKFILMDCMLVKREKNNDVLVRNYM
ncbi:hypothetical protein CFP56_027672 [Quercus suber]|uniref:Uncharacterized protein n=1 Tax=Quercus suber TaxID=58331 RepID=A0AAW0JY02_QUESU|nr:hypothetical protein CFP56_47265 [Quercus suber]